MLVTNSLAAVGINFHDWPEGYLSLGATTSNPVPGDIIVYSGHVAVYIGNGQAVHGGWLGSQTVVASVSCDKALIAYVHIA
ncbi:nlpC/P60 family [Firmicutes bacterium CAG:536]|nr:nlpC/P60 family [Firmicutes bacterium CAG:536]